VRIVVEEVVAAGLADVTWKLYNEAFDELRSTAVQRHVMLREEFENVMADARVAKYFCLDTASDDRMCAAGTITNDLDAMPLISPDYFRRRWPLHYAQGRIWYIGFVAVHPEYRRSAAFARVVEQMCDVVSARNGVAALDVCRRNEELYRLPQAIHRLLFGYTGSVHSERMDEQSYWCYEFPAAT
jgi:hypothetical protein